MNVVDKYKLQPFIKLQHRLTCARWDEPAGKWHLTIRKSRTSEPAIDRTGALKSPTYDHWEEIHDVVDILFLGVGSLSRWTWPDIKGLEMFSGEVIHSAQWDTTEHENNWKDKNVAVIGVVCSV